MTTLRFRTSCVWGSKSLYPMPEIAEQWEKLTGFKTASKSKLKVLRELGHQILIDEGHFLVKEIR